MSAVRMNSISKGMMVFAAFLMLALYGSGFAYAGARVLRFLRAVILVPDGSGSSILGGVSPVHIYIGLWVFFVLFIALGFVPLNKSIQRHFVWFAWFMVGTTMYLLMFYILTDLIVLTGRLTRLIETPTPRNVIIPVSCFVFILTACFVGYAVYHAKQLKHVSYEVTLGKEDIASESLNVVLIADTHLGYLNGAEWMEKIAREINTVEPDIVCIAGDIFTDNYRALANPDKAAESLSSINSRYGVYAALGNHDSGRTYPEMLDFLKRGNVTVLQDEHVVIDDKFILLGRTDPTPIRGGPKPRQDIAEVLGAIDERYKNLPIIVIDHQPNNISEYGNDVDLILAGHTHRGSFFPATLVTRRTNYFNYGHVQKSENRAHVIVTSGAGLWGPPFRLGSDNEIVSINVGFSS